jgi:cystathionine beta-lyase/cystathionine gamma-synthase
MSRSSIDRSLAPVPSPAAPDARPAPAARDFDTRCVAAGLGHGDGNPLVTPLVQSSTFCRGGVDSICEHQYSRVSNPTVAALEDALAALEDAERAVSFGTGLAAETALFLALLRGGDHVVCGRSVYGGTTRLLQQLLPDLGVRATFVDATDVAAVQSAIEPTTRLVFVETPSNPTLELTDLAAVAAVAREAGAVLAVDNTFLTAVLQQPLDLGAHVSVYSTTKFVDGHSVALGGALVTRDPQLRARFAFIRKCTGAIQSPLNAWLTLQGLRTLPLRLRRQSETAATVAAWLAGRADVARVHHPSLASDARARRIARQQHLGADGAVLSFEPVGGLDAAARIAERVQLARLVEHVGSVETLITHPATMTHADVPADERRAAGLPDGLLRLSVGLESPAAIIDDLAAALDAAGTASATATTTTTTKQEVTPCLTSV